MSDPFEDYLRELQRRERARRGAKPGEDTSADETPGDGSGSGGDAGRSGATGRTGDRPGSGTAQDAEAPGTDEEEGAPAEEPEPIGLRRRRARSDRRGGGPRRPVGGPTDGSYQGGFRGAGRAIGIVIVVFVLFLFVAVSGSLVDLWTDAIWFRSVGFEGVLWTRVGAQVVLFLVAVLGVLAILGLDLWVAGRLAPPPGSGGSRVRDFVARLNEAATAGPSGGAGPFFTRDRYGGAWGPFGQPPEARGPEARGPEARGRGQAPDLEVEMPDLAPIGRWVLVAIAALAAFTLAGRLSGGWETILLWQHRVPFSPTGTPVTDPVFGRDVSFFLFDLPFFRLVQSVVNGILIAALLIALGRYLIAALRGGLEFGTAPRLHLGLLAGLWLLSVAVGYQLDKLELSYSTHGVAAGVSFTDANARFLAFDALTVIAALTAAFLVASAFTRLLWPVVLAVTVWFVASIALGTVYPEIVQRFTVAPNEFATEEPYIRNNISMTRLAYSLDTWDVRPYQGTSPLTTAAFQSDAATFDNARLWDYRPLGKTLDQLQTVRQYYDFYDVDTDRYTLLGRERQLMLSARELALEKNPQAGTWLNQRIVFTHGYGLAMVPVNAVTGQGLPQLIVRDLPPVSSDGAPDVTEPRIYFGERPADWVIVGARQQEFDYPVASGQGGGDVSTRWKGTTGIGLDSTFARLLFAFRFRDLNLLISDQITSESRLLMYRTLNERLAQIAPFLRYDKDPYLVVTPQGRLVYIQDAYTLSDRFPASEPFDGALLGQTSGLAGEHFNYIRNSVKVVMDAYDGSMSFYVSDPTDPLIRAYEGVFPGLFRPIGDLPAELKPHLRWPEEIFNVQSRTYARYHVTNAQTFYNKDDLWTIPTNPQGATQQLPPEAYYVIMRMPGETQPEFLLLQPMVPALRPNMIAWMAARNDGDAYGQVRVYQFPRDTTIFGPTQIEARIDQDPTISGQITLWNQSGSTVIRGNLLVVPVGDTIVYLEPIYLQSTSSAFPQFTKVVVATPDKVAWADTLAKALDLVIAGGPGPTAGPTPSVGPSPSPGVSPVPSPTAGPNVTPRPDDLAALIEYANLHFSLAQTALRQGDFATYGDEMKKVQSALEALGRLTGGSPAPAPSSLAPAVTPAPLPTPTASSAP